MKFSTTAMARWFFVAGVAAALMATGCGGEKKTDEPNRQGDTTKPVAKPTQQAVTLELCGDCCSISGGAQPTITIVSATSISADSVRVTATTSGTEDLPCMPADSAKGMLGSGLYLAIIVDDAPTIKTSHEERLAADPYDDTLVIDSPSVARGYLLFNPTAYPYGVSVKYPAAAVAWSFNGGTWTKNTTTPMVILNLPKYDSSYPAANVPLDFVPNNAPLGANFKLRVVIPSTLDTVIDQNKPYRIKNLPAGAYTVTVQLLKPKTGGGWEDVSGEFAHSSRTFTVQ